MSANPPPQVPSPGSRFITMWGFIAITAILYFGRDVLIPLAMAVLVSFLLSPVILWLEKHGIKRIFAVILTVLVLMAAVGGLTYLLTNQFVEFVDNLPSYRKNIVTKIHAIKPGRTSVLKRAEAALKDISKEVESETTATANLNTTSTATSAASTLATSAVTTTVAQPPTADLSLQIPGISSAHQSDTPLAAPPPPTGLQTTTPSEDPAAAIPVRIVTSPGSTFENFETIVGPITTVLANIGLVILMVIFILLEREDLRDRVIRLAGQNKIRVTTEALEEATSRVSRYLLMQLIVNVTYGIPVALGLWLIGIPNALLWGVMATILRFIPYAGPWIAASLPVALSLAVFESWTMPALTIGLFIVLEILSNNFMEPILYGHSTGISPVAIILAAVFWAWLWGPVGLVLATPITVCLVVLGGYIPQLAFLRVLLGDEQVLDDDARIYNRLLSGATDDAIDVAEEYLDKNDLPSLYDNVLLPALERTETDRNEDMLTEERYEKLISGINELLESVNDRVAEKEAATEKLATEEGEKVAGAAGDLLKPAAPETPVSPMPRRVAVCVPVNDKTDEVAARMLRQLTQSRDIDFHVLAAGTLVGEVMKAVKDMNADVIILSSVPPFAVAHARYLAKRLTAEFPEKKIFAGLWVGENTVQRADQRLRSVGVNQIYTKLQEAALHL